MFKFLRKTTLSTRLIVIGIIPVIFLSYFSYLIYQEKNLKIDLISDNIRKVGESQVAQDLMNRLAYERRYSFNFLHNSEEHDILKKQRVKTDSSIKSLERSEKGLNRGFPKYHFLQELNAFRTNIDTTHNIDPNIVLQFYTDLIYRINSMNTPSPPIGLFSYEVYQNFVSQKVLNDIITYLSIIRTQVYSYLTSRQVNKGYLLDNPAIFKTYKSLETEFLTKSPKREVEKYKSFQSNKTYVSTLEKIDSIYNSPTYIYSDSAAEWYAESADALVLLRAQQRDIWNKVNASMNHTKKAEIKKRNLSLFFLIFSITILTGILLSFGISLIKILNNIASAANKISRGATNVAIENTTKGSLGVLENSILNIRDYNLELSEAANEIGKGNFNVTVNPRSEDDKLGRSIKKMKQDLREYTRQKDVIQRETMELVHQRDDFFNITSHELKTPITSLKAYAQLLLMEYEHDVEAPQRTMILKMEQQTNKLIALINNLLDAYKIQNEQLTFTPQEVKLNTIVQEAIKSTHVLHPQFKIIFQKNMNGSVKGDTVRLRQVVENLLENAVKYSPVSKEAIVRLEKSENTIICSVKDFGLGIKPEETTKVFNRFYRITGEYMHTYPGIGLGLYISSEIIKLHHGKMWMESEFGKGSTFYFELPLA